jgi:dipeptidyl aminopeptidase/acylaminoacyl peptidase
VRRVAIVLAAIALCTVAPADAVRSTSACPAALAAQHDLGRLAFVDGTRLELLDVAQCRVQKLVAAGVEPPLRWSADGRYLAFGAGTVVAARGGTPTRPLGRLALGWGSGSPGWVWSPRGHRLAGVTERGGVVVGGPGTGPRRLWPDGWGATSIAWSPNGRTLAVSRSLYLKAPAPYHQEIWLVDLHSGAKRILFRLRKPQLAPPWLSGFSPDGRWLLAWEDVQNSASLAADGLPLIALRAGGGKAVAVGKGTLVYSDFLSWCTGDLLAYVLDNGGRQVTLGDRIDLAGPAPRWPVVTAADPGARAQLSFVSPACSPPGQFSLAAAVGRATPDEPFGRERRAIWLLPYTGGNWRPLEAAPPAGSSDELPSWSRDGRWLAFVRTTWTGRSGSGRLYLLELGARFNGHARLVGPVADVGRTGNYYGHYDWAAALAWFDR